MSFPVLSLAEARAAMDAAYDAKGLAARDLKRAVTRLRQASPSDREDLRAAVGRHRYTFNTASRALAHAEAAFRAAEERDALSSHPPHVRSLP